MKKTKWEVVGYANVDSGLMMLCDPCYALSDEVYQKATDELWEDVNELKNNYANPKEVVIKHIAGNAIITPTFDGDGSYEVSVRKDVDSGRVTEMRIKFI